MLHLNISLKNFCASPSRFRFISIALRLWRFSFFLLSALRFQLPFFRFGSAKVEIFFLSASFFWKFYFSFSLPLRSFSIPSSIALSGLCSPCLGLQRWDSFFISARSFVFVVPLFWGWNVFLIFHFLKKFFKLFSRFFSALFSILKAALRCLVFVIPFRFGTAKVRFFFYLSKYENVFVSGFIAVRWVSGWLVFKVSYEVSGMGCQGWGIRCQRCM